MQSLDQEQSPVQDIPNAVKRPFSIIRNTILLELLKGDRTINQIAVNTNINWKTVENHLTYLLGKRFVQEIFSSRFVRIFSMSPHGKLHITALRASMPSDGLEDDGQAEKMSTGLFEVKPQ